MTKQDRLKKCEAVYDMGHITEGKALSTTKMMVDFAMRFWDCVLIHPEMYDMFYKYIEEQPYERNAMRSILNNMQDFKHYFQGSTPHDERRTRGEKKDNQNYEGKRLQINKKVPSLYNPMMMLSRLMIPCVDCACDPNVRETRRGGFHLRECQENHEYGKALVVNENCK